MILKHYAFADGTDNLKFEIKTQLQANNDENINKILAYNYASFGRDSYYIDNPRPFYKGQGLAYSSFVTDSAGNFSEPIVIDVDIEKMVNFSGITLSCNQTIKRIKFNMYSADTMVEELSLYNEDDSNFFRTNSENISKVRITIYSIKDGYNFLDIFGIYFGKVYVFEEKDFKTPKMVNNISVSGRELPIDTFSFELYDKPDDLLFDNNQKVEIIIDKVPEYTFFVDKFENDGENSFKVSCVDCVSLLEETYEGGYFEKVEARTIAKEILDDTNLPYEFTESLGDFLVTGYIPVTTKRNGLIYLANALGCKILKQPSLKFVNYKDSAITFDDDSIFFGTFKLNKETPSKSVELSAFNYHYVLSDSGDYEEVYGEYLKAGSHIIYLQKGCDPDEEYTDIKALNEKDGVSIGSDTFVQGSIKITTNAIRFEINKDCYVVIKQAMFLESKKATIIKKIPNADLYKNYNVETIDTFSLMRCNIDDDNVDYYTRADELLKYYSINETAKARVVWKKPMLDYFVDLYGEKYAVNKLTTSFTDAVEIEVTKIVD